MEFNLFTDYSFRVLIYLGARKGSLATVAEIAEAYDVSRHHIVKVVHRLGQLGYLQTHRGRGGGIELARAAEQISVGELARELESSTLVECFKPGPKSCCIVKTCQLKQALAEAQSAFFKVLDGYTLADLIRPRRALARSLAIEI